MGWIRPVIPGDKPCQRLWACHVCGWLLLWFMESMPVLSEPARVLRRGGLLLFAMPSVYAHFWAMDRLLLKGRWRLYLVSLAAILGVGALVNQVALRVLVSESVSFYLGFASATGFLLVTAGLRQGALGIRDMLALRELREKQVQDELALLKHQINPHFLFNTLNNLYALARKHEDPRLGEGLASLARLMRYLIEETRADLVPLDKELSQLKAYVELQKLRFSPQDDPVISLDIQGDPAGALVAPMLFIPFVENAFKHAPSFQQAVRIAIHVEISPRELWFRVENTVNRSRKQTEPGPGIGMANVKRRLDLQYPGRHELEVQDGQDRFLVQLKLRREEIP